MEGSQSQNKTANAETPADEVPVLTGLFRTLGGVSLIAMLSSILMGIAGVFRWTDVFIPNTVVLVGVLVLLGVIVLFLMVTLPMRLNQVRDVLTRGAGLILLVYSLMVSRYALCPFLYVPIPLGPDTPHWTVYSATGILLLVEPTMRRVSLLRGLPHSVLDGLVLCLGLLTAALTQSTRPALNGLLPRQT